MASKERRKQEECDIMEAKRKGVLIQILSRGEVELEPEMTVEFNGINVPYLNTRLKTKT